VGIEVANYVNQLVATNPLSSDPKSEGDDHLRLLKAVLLATFPNVGGAVTLTHTQINALVAAVAAAVTLTDDQAIAGVKTFSDSPIVPTPTTDFQASTKEYTDTAAAAATPPAGAVMFFAMSTAPTGWLKADGALVSRTTYATLFAAIGTTFGVGDGSTTFGLPDLRGEFIRGFDDGKGTDSGRVFGAGQASQMQSHTHTFNANGNGNGSSSNYPLGGSEYIVPTIVTVSATGGTTNSSENRPRNIALLACIKI
jgi:microcystin-dependent protein